MRDATIPHVDVTIPEVTQVGLVVEDLEDAVRRFGALLGVDPWFLYRYEPPRLADTTYRGEAHDYSMRVALADVEGPLDLATDLVSGRLVRRFLDRLTSLRDRIAGLLAPGDRADEPVASLAALPNPGLPGLNVELIEPLRGPSIYTEHLEEHGEGLHHVACFAFDDPRAVVDEYADAGISVLQSGRFEGMEFWYLDTAEELNGLVFETAAGLGSLPEPDGVLPGEPRYGSK